MLRGRDVLPFRLPPGRTSFLVEEGAVVSLFFVYFGCLRFPFLSYWVVVCRGCNVQLLMLHTRNFVVRQPLCRGNCVTCVGGEGSNTELRRGALCRVGEVRTGHVGFLEGSFCTYLTIPWMAQLFHKNGGPAFIGPLSHVSLKKYRVVVGEFFFPSLLWSIMHFFSHWSNLVSLAVCHGNWIWFSLTGVGFRQLQWSLISNQISRVFLGMSAPTIPEAPR